MIQIKIKSSAKKPYESGLSTTVGLILNRTKGVRIEERTNPEPSSSSLLGLLSLDQLGFTGSSTVLRKGSS